MFYDKFESICKSRGISPSKAAAEVGLNRSAVVKWKNGATPQTSTIKKLSEYFGIDIMEFLGDGTKSSVAAAYAEGFEAARTTYQVRDSKFTYALENEARDLTDEDKELLISMAKRLGEARRTRDKKQDASPTEKRLVKAGKTQNGRARRHVR